jgi:hypothetical protein
MHTGGAACVGFASIVGVFLSLFARFHKGCIGIGVQEEYIIRKHMRDAKNDAVHWSGWRRDIMLYTYYTWNTDTFNRRICSRRPHLGQSRRMTTKE